MLNLTGLPSDSAMFSAERNSKIREGFNSCNPRGPYKKSLIHFAAMGDCTALLQSLLEIGCPVDDLDQNNRTPFSWAAENGSLSAIKLLLKNGAKVNSLDYMYVSLFSWLVKRVAL